MGMDFSKLSDEQLMALATGKDLKINVVPEGAKLGYQDRAVDIAGGQSAAVGMGPLDAAAVAAGRTFSNIGAGVRQAGNWLGNRPSEPLRSEREAQSDAYSAIREKHPFATAIGESAPYLAIPPSAGLFGGAGIVGGIEASQYGSPEERGRRGLLGLGTALAGGAAGKFVGGALNPAGPMTEVKKNALQSAMSIGYRPRLSETTGSPMMARIEDAAARIPGGAGVMQSQADANSRALTRAASKSIGENTDELGPSVMGAAADRMGKVFEGIKNLGKVNVNGRQVNPIEIGGNVASVADDILRQQSKMIKGQKDEALVELANQAKTLANNKGRIDGETYQLVRSGLSEASYDASGTNRVLYGKLLNALDESADTSLRAIGQNVLADQLKTVRPQYGNKILLEKGATLEGGQVSPAKVASSMRTQNPAAFREGGMSKNPLYDVAMVGENLKPLRQGSQTFERETVLNPLSLALYSPLSYGAAQVATNPLLNRYVQFAGQSPAMGLLSDISNPAVRAATMGYLTQTPISTK